VVEEERIKLRTRKSGPKGGRVEGGEEDDEERWNG
jgi:hypothetical protein